MRVYSFIELFHFTRTELFALHARIAAELAALPEGAAERTIALETLRDIRRVLAQVRIAPP